MEGHYGYFKRLLDPKMLMVKLIWKRMGETTPNFVMDKKIFMNKTQLKSPPHKDHKPDYVDLWFYGFDWDTDGKESEHVVSIIDREGKPRKVGVLPPLTEPVNGNNRSLCCIIRKVPLEEYPISNWKVLLHNPLGKWSGSIFYALYIMPHDPMIDSEGATKLIRSELGRVRIKSLGFTEADTIGIQNNDGQTLEIPVLLYRE